MNKQQLASKIWESANRMRSKIEANEYKDYILGFIFYKFLSEKQLEELKKVGFTEEDIKSLNEEETDGETIDYIREIVGYFISYDNLFSTWINKGSDFNVSNVRDALSAFNRLIHKDHKKIFDGILETLETGLSKLGDSASSQTKAISDLIHLIKDIPMDSKEDYDVLGFVYEYLISNFAANAGKKAGEFYTPYEVAILMSEIIAYHLRGREKIGILDPTSGSGSLLITIGNSASKHIDGKNNIKYYAQELKRNTYNLTRMNLIMRGIIPENIFTRNADTLESDWPYFDENDPINTYETLYVDAVVSNPPYSQKWEPENKETDPRYSRFGLAPKSKADYAFLLHDLYHLKPDGIMAIVLPHGVLFRGGEEGEIRKNLIEYNHIDAVIGLPSNIFFGTGIPTVIMILKQKRENTDILFVDASKGFVKEGKNNRLRAKDIKRVADVVKSRLDIEHFSRAVSRDEIRENEYNLNIPRYIQSSDNTESWDIYATMFGGVPEHELQDLEKYWTAFSGLKESLFTKSTEKSLSLNVEDINSAVVNHPSVISFKDKYDEVFNIYNDFLKKELFKDIDSININRHIDILSDELFNRFEEVSLIDKYDAYQLLDDKWNDTKIDIEMIQSEGFETTKRVDANMVVRRRRGKDEEIQDGWKGRILPFSLVQENHFKEDLEKLIKQENRIVEIASEIEEIIESFTEEEKDSPVLNDNNDAFVVSGMNAQITEFFENIETEEIKVLNKYIQLLDDRAKKEEKLDFIKANSIVDWKQIEANRDGIYGKANVNRYLSKLQSEYSFPEDSFEEKVVRASNLMEEEKELKRQIKDDSDKLHHETKEKIESLTDDEVYSLLEKKWISDLINQINKLSTELISGFIAKITHVVNKYATTLEDVTVSKSQVQKELSELMNDLAGSDDDIEGIKAWQELLNN